MPVQSLPPHSCCRARARKAWELMLQSLLPHSCLQSLLRQTPSHGDARNRDAVPNAPPPWQTPSRTPSAALPPSSHTGTRTKIDATPRTRRACNRNRRTCSTNRIAWACNTNACRGLPVLQAALCCEYSQPSDFSGVFSSSIADSETPEWESVCHGGAEMYSESRPDSGAAAG